MLRLIQERDADNITMENNFNTPIQVIEGNINGAVSKAKLKLPKMILMGLFAGLFIAIGASASSLASHDISNVGLARTITGVVFPVGLMMIIVIGGELFTGNSMMVMAAVDKKITAVELLRNWIVVYISNLAGSVVAAFIIYMSGQFDYTSGKLGAYTIKIAMGKADIGFGKAVFSGIMCNILVCAAVLMAGAAKDIIGKLFSVFFPIFAFVVSGYEHCVANMYYIPAGIFASNNQSYVDKACEVYGYTSEQIAETLTLGGFFGSNLLPVTIGNLIGGGVIISLGLYTIYRSKVCNPKVNTDK